MIRKFILMGLLFAMCPGLLRAQVAVIVHKDVPVEQLTQVQLLDFYTGDVKRWDKDRPIVVLNLKPQTAVTDSFYRLLGKTPSRMKSIWMKKMLSGEGDPPEALPSEAALLQKVASTPGAIGFVSPDSVNKSVKMLRILKDKNWSLF